MTIKISTEEIKKQKVHRVMPKVRLEVHSVDVAEAECFFEEKGEAFWALWDAAENKEQLILDQIASYESDEPDYNIDAIISILREWCFMKTGHGSKIEISITLKDSL